MTLLSFQEYIDSLTNLSVATDPTVLTAEGAAIRAAARALGSIEVVSRAALNELIQEHPEYVLALGYAVGLSHEALKNALKHHLDTSGWIKLARENPASIIHMLDDQYDLVRLVDEQRHKVYEFGDVLVARAGPRARWFT
jgi:choline dehydrogenase-like flavoprotein